MREVENNGVRPKDLKSSSATLNSCVISPWTPNNTLYSRSTTKPERK